jgi:chromosome segregation ATPase
MMTFNDIKAFIDFANNTDKYQHVIDQLDKRQKEWEALVEVYTKVENASKYIAEAEAVAQKSKDDIEKERQVFEAQKAKETEKLDAAKAKAKTAQEKAEALKASWEEKHAAVETTLLSAKQDAEAVASLKNALDKQLTDTQALASEYQDKLDKINAVLKQV